MATWEQQRFEDQDTWLSILGCLMLGLAVLCILGAVFVLAMRIPNASMAAGAYVGPILGLSILGTGLLRKRRWARALAQACGWIAAASTVIGVAVMLPLAGGSDAAPRFILIIACCAMFGFGIVLPVAIAWFLGSRNARMTCEHYDPVPRWTDGLPLLTLILTTFLFWTGFATLAVVIGPPGPLFGTFLPPIVSRGISAGISVAWLALGAGLAARKEAAWWGALALSIVVGVSNVLNALRVPMEEIYRRAGMTPVQISQMKGLMGSWPALLIVPSVAFVGLIVAERVFRNRAPQAPAEASAASR